jgi:hypothetical protein
LFAVPGKAALYLENDSSVAGAGINVGVALSWGARQLLYVPGAAALPAALRYDATMADVIAAVTDDQILDLAYYIARTK